jgi:positive regulator of sigma E activity
MLQTENNISHPGIIQLIGEKTISVLIISKSACNSCDAKKSCVASEMEEKIIEVPKTIGKEFKIGENVTVSMNQTTGNWAVAIGYLFPFIVLISSLILLMKAGLSEGLAGLGGLAILGIYYGLLYFFNKSISKKFQFFIQ